MGGNEFQPWSAFCRDMNADTPKEYLPLADCYSELGDGLDLVSTTYGHVRFDPVSLYVNPLDATFAATTALGALANFMPDARAHLPAGWAQFAGRMEGAQPAARAHVDLSGTGFAFAAAIASSPSFFCTYNGDPPLGDSSASTRELASDRRSFHLTAINTQGEALTKTVADCASAAGTAPTRMTSSRPLGPSSTSDWNE